MTLKELKWEIWSLTEEGLTIEEISEYTSRSVEEIKNLLK